MAWNYINHTCGHQDRVQLYGPGRDRERKIAWLETKPCPACVKTEREKLRAEETEAAKQQSAGLPVFKGTEPQIEWAHRVRAMARPNLELAVGAYEGPFKEEFTACSARILRQTSASFWIDNRDRFVSRDTCAYYIGRRLQDERDRAAGAAAIAGNQPNE
jgi:hypothetical protein